MAATIKGTAVFWSTEGITFTAGIISSTHGSLVQSSTVERTSEVARIKGTDGTIKTMVFSGHTKSLRITVVPTSVSGTNTIANARLSADAHVPKAGLLITVADDSGTGTVVEGNYNCVSASQNRTVDGVLTVDLTLEAGDEGVDVTGPVS